MVMKQFDNMGKNLTQTWADEADIIQFKNGEVKEIRIAGLGYVPLYRHWVPFKKKKGGLGFFPHDCQRYSAKTGEFDDALECEACDRELMPDEQAVMLALDVDLLFEGDIDKALGIVIFGGREQQKIQKLTQFNKVDKTPYNVADPKYGCSIQVLFDKDNRDKALRWQFTKGQRIPIQIKEDLLRVKIPKNADSDHAGEIFEFEMYDIAELIYPVEPAKAREKFKRWQVDEAVAIMNKERDKEDGADEDEDEQEEKRRKARKAAKRRKAEEDATGDPRRRSKKEKRMAPPEDDFDDDDATEEKEDPDDDGDDDFTEEQSPKKQRRKSSPPPEDDDFDEDDKDSEDDDEVEPEREERPKKSKLTSKKDKLLAKKKSLLNKKKEALANKKKPSKPKCFGHLGEDDTEDCTECNHVDACTEKSSDAFEDE